MTQKLIHPSELGGEGPLSPDLAGRTLLIEVKLGYPGYRVSDLLVCGTKVQVQNADLRGAAALAYSATAMGLAPAPADPAEAEEEPGQVFPGYDWTSADQRQAQECGWELTQFSDGQICIVAGDLDTDECTPSPYAAHPEPNLAAHEHVKATAAAPLYSGAPKPSYVELCRRAMQIVTATIPLGAVARGEVEADDWGEPIEPEQPPAEVEDQRLRNQPPLRSRFEGIEHSDKRPPVHGQPPADEVGPGLAEAMGGPLAQPAEDRRTAEQIMHDDLRETGFSVESLGAGGEAFTLYRNGWCVMVTGEDGGTLPSPSSWGVGLYVGSFEEEPELFYTSRWAAPVPGPVVHRPEFVEALEEALEKIEQPPEEPRQLTDHERIEAAVKDGDGELSEAHRLYSLHHVDKVEDLGEVVGAALKVLASQQQALRIFAKALSTQEN